MRLLGMLISVGLVALVACAQSQKTEGPIERGVASSAAPNDFDPNREHFDGSKDSIVHEFKLMRGNLERGKALAISTERDNLLRNNLFDTGVDMDPKLDCKTIMARGREDFILHHRTESGLCYMYKQGPNFKGVTEVDLSRQTKMGAADQRFGRNSPPPTTAQIQEHQANILNPNPVLISQTFFSRKDGFQPVPWVNLLASAWLQAQNHDWFSHGQNVTQEHLKDLTPAEQAMYAKMFQPYEVTGPGGVRYMIPRTKPDLTFLNGKVPGFTYATGRPAVNEVQGRQYGAKFRNSVTHWWDASHIYGSDQKTVLKIRTIPSGVNDIKDSFGNSYKPGQIYPDGKIAVDELNRKLYYRNDPDSDNELLPITGFHDNWWLGLEMIHTTFALEHNKVATALRQTFDNTSASAGPVYAYYHSIKKDPVKKSEFLYDKARLVVTALIAKIHTVEWTPALLDNPGLRMGMFANWHGLKTAIGDIESPLLRGVLQRTAGINARFLASGLIGKGSLNLYKVPFTLTEEFVSVYRMHPLLADELNVIRFTEKGDNVSAKIEVNETRDSKVEGLLTQRGFNSTDYMYSFGRNKAGLMTLHNYPKFMENMEIRRNIAGQKQSNPLLMNMGAVDIVRDRERMTPRYNEFRRMMRMRPLKKFEELFVTSKVLYEDNSKFPAEYQAVVAELRAALQARGFDMPMIERDINKIPDFSKWKAIKDTAKGGLAGFLNDGKVLPTEDDFYAFYYDLPVEKQHALLTQQERQDVASMNSIYGDVEKLDLLVGTLAEEDRFDLFGFGNTPFYIFALMASRRLMTDPFLSDLYTADVYSKAGIDWVEKNSMIDVIKRNFPELEPKFAGVKNAFHPWNPN